MFTRKTLIILPRFEFFLVKKISSFGRKKNSFYRNKKKQQPSKSSRNIHKFKEINRIKNRRQTTKKWPNDKIEELASMKIVKEKLKGQKKEKDLSKEKNHISQKKAVDALAILR